MFSRNLEKPCVNLRKGERNQVACSAWVQDTQVVPQRPEIIKQIRRRRHVCHFLTRQINRQQVGTFELDEFPGRNFAVQPINDWLYE